MSTALDRMARASTRGELVDGLSPWDVDVALRGGERAARALDLENSGRELGALAIVGRCVAAGHFEPPEVRR